MTDLWFQNMKKLVLAACKRHQARSHRQQLGVEMLETRALPSFLPAVNYAADRPQAVAVGDFNGDGTPDIATVSIGGNVNIFLANSDGSFQPSVSFPAGTSPFDMTVGDFNGDGFLDLAVATRDNHAVSVLLGNGDGTFRAPQRYACPNPIKVAVADLNGDGNLDLVAGNVGTNTFSVLLGNGDGTFQPALTSPLGGYPAALALADLNGDGIPDLVAPNDAQSNGVVNVLLGNGDGTFQAPVAYRSANVSFAVAVADLNGDGIPDIVTANNTGSGTFGVLFGNGDGTFRSVVLNRTDSYPDALAVADIDGDGIPDVITANGSDSNSISVCLGNGDGTFQPARNYRTDMNVSSTLAVADFNGDGYLDVVTAQAYARTGSISVLLNAGDWPDAPGRSSQGRRPEREAQAAPGPKAVPDLARRQQPADVAIAGALGQSASRFVAHAARGEGLPADVVVAVPAAWTTPPGTRQLPASPEPVLVRAEATRPLSLDRIFLDQGSGALMDALEDAARPEV